MHFDLKQRDGDGDRGFAAKPTHDRAWEGGLDGIQDELSCADEADE